MHMAAFSARTYLLSLSPPSPPLSLPPINAITGQLACAPISAPPLPHTPQQDYGQILATSPKVEDGPHLGVCEYGS